MRDSASEDGRGADRGSPPGSPQSRDAGDMPRPGAESQEDPALRRAGGREGPRHAIFLNRRVGERGPGGDEHAGPRPHRPDGVRPPAPRDFDRDRDWDRRPRPRPGDGPPPRDRDRELPRVLREFAHIPGACERCGRLNHVLADCAAVKNIHNAYIRDDYLASRQARMSAVWGPKPLMCHRCGRKDHHAGECFHKADVAGGEIRTPPGVVPRFAPGDPVPSFRCPRCFRTGHAYDECTFNRNVYRDDIPGPPPRRYVPPSRQLPPGDYPPGREPHGAAPSGPVPAHRPDRSPRVPPAEEGSTPPRPSRPPQRWQPGPDRPARGGSEVIDDASNPNPAPRTASGGEDMRDAGHGPPLDPVRPAINALDAPPLPVERPPGDRPGHGGRPGVARQGLAGATRGPGPGQEEGLPPVDHVAMLGDAGATERGGSAGAAGTADGAVDARGEGVSGKGSSEAGTGPRGAAGKEARAEARVSAEQGRAVGGTGVQAGGGGAGGAREGPGASAAGGAPTGGVMAAGANAGAPQVPSTAAAPPPMPAPPQPYPGGMALPFAPAPAPAALSPDGEQLVQLLMRTDTREAVRYPVVFDFDLGCLRNRHGMALPIFTGDRAVMLAAEGRSLGEILEGLVAEGVVAWGDAALSDGEGDDTDAR